MTPLGCATLASLSFFLVGGGGPVSCTSLCWGPFPGLARGLGDPGSFDAEWRWDTAISHFSVCPVTPEVLGPRRVRKSKGIHGGCAGTTAISTPALHKQECPRDQSSSRTLPPGAPGRPAMTGPAFLPGLRLQKSRYRYTFPLYMAVQLWVCRAARANGITIASLPEQSQFLRIF